jgi:hypothetical protein
MTPNIQSRAIGILVALAGLVLAVFLGRFIAHESYFQIILGAAIIFCVIFSLTAGKYILPFGLFLSFATPLITPAGISMDIIEQSVFMMILVILPCFWVKEPGIRMPFSAKFSYQAYLFCVVTFCAYLIIHTFMAKYLPYPGMSFSAKGIARIYMALIVPFVLIAIFTRRQFGITCPKNATRVAARLIFLGLLINVGIRIATILIAGPDVMKADAGATTVQGKNLPYLINIPIIGLHENIFGLRVAGPLGVLIGSLLLLANSPRASTRCSLGIITLGIIGSALSGGRATLLISMAYILLAIWLSKHRAILTVGVGIIAAFFASLIVMPAEVTTSLPMTIQRSIVWFTPSLQGTRAEDSVTSSTNTRKLWFWNAIDAWQESSRAFWLGRSVSTVTEEDVRSFISYDERGMLEFNVKRGTTHNLITNLLVGFGLVGCILYYFTIISLILFLFAWLRKLPLDSEARPWVFAAAVSTTVYICYASVGGGYLWAQNLIVILFALVINARDIRAAEEKREIRNIQPISPPPHFRPR